ncbi:aryl hydrocarbon receptor nuclear translocator-like protein 2 [Latimeria chalumnae]|uniref:aryl hydrocarbon receptor nuclear translocator-like protein 2 n=1 Tax=Latimeria chalumnae TaxID=7897 RepID=UPI00313E3D07
MSEVEFPRKRKGNTSEIQDNMDADMDNVQSRDENGEQHVKVKCFREAHSQIEKRRRDKMNNLIDELSVMIPPCNPVARKLDKLTVLRMAVQHLKSLKGASSSFAEATYKPSFLPHDELKHLVLKAADGFLFVVRCDRGKLLFVSESVSKILNHSRANLIGQSLFDYLHPKDIAKVKEQLSSSDVSPREKLIDAKSGMQVQAAIPAGSTRLCSGVWRSFFCRMKYNKVAQEEEEGKEFLSISSKKKDPKRYCTIHCTGYLKNWSPNQVALPEESDSEKDSSNFSCLVAIGRSYPHTVPQKRGEIKVKPTEFVTRYTMDGKFTFVDQRATAILGYLPQEMLGTSCYEYFHQDDLNHLADCHRKVLQSKEKIATNVYKFKTKHGLFITLKSWWFSFTNPWTKEVEYIVSTNTVLIGSAEPINSLVACDSQSSEDSSKKCLPVVPGTSSGTMIGAGNIGVQIANAVMDSARLNSSPSGVASSPTDLLRKSPPALNTSNVPNGEAVHSVPSETLEPSAAGQESITFPNSEFPFSENSQLDFDIMAGPEYHSLSNDESVMALFMGLLEADVHIGGPENSDDVQWDI